MKSYQIGDKVTILKGFFKGTLGVVAQVYAPDIHSSFSSYGVRMGNETGLTWFEHEELQVV